MRESNEGVRRSTHYITLTNTELQALVTCQEQLNARDGAIANLTAIGHQAVVRAEQAEAAAENYRLNTLNLTQQLNASSDTCSNLREGLLAYTSECDRLTLDKIALLQDSVRKLFIEEIKQAHRINKS